MGDNIIVTGGAGFIGSHMVRLLVDQGANVTVIDDMSQGHVEALPAAAELVIADIADFEVMCGVIASRPWTALFHFAALSLVGESMADPMRYFRKNTAATFGLIEAAVRYQIPRFILSSTANLFGTPDRIPITEDSPVNPTSPYGESKLMIEQALRWADRRHGLRSACLRYFNAAGSDPGGRLGEDHTPETHLIPLLIDAAIGRRDAVTIFGDDYPTRDGTCIRDYIHVTDLCSAHLCALNQLQGGSLTYNVGSGRGYSVMEVIAAVEAASGRRVPVRMGPRREGDPAVLVASPSLIKGQTGWAPRYSQLDDIVRTAHAWRVAHPNGYRGASPSRLRMGRRAERAVGVRNLSGAHAQAV